MGIASTDFGGLEARVAAGQPLSVDDAARVLGSTDLIAVGMLGETARKAQHGDRVTYGRVCIVGTPAPANRGEAAEVRVATPAASLEDALSAVRAAASIATGVPLTGFSTAALLELAGHDHLVLADISRALSAAGLEAVAESPIDRLGDTENAVEVIRAVRHGGLGVWRLTVDRAAAEERLALIERAAAVQHALHGVHAFAPLPRLDPVETPSTGYDDVRTVAAARLVCRGIPSIQIDWQLYGPKLAQVAIAFGADDIDNVSAVDVLQLGHRRSPREDIERQIRAAFAQPAERDGRFALRS